MTNVKMTRPKVSNNKKLSIIFGCTIATILLLIVLKVVLSSNKETKSVTGSIFGPRPKSAPVQKAPPVKLPPDLEKEARAKNLTPEGYLKLRAGNRLLNTHEIERRKKQAKLIGDFKKKTHLDLAYPAAMEYLDLDLDENVATILGMSLDGKKSFAVLATPGKISLNQALDYLMSNTDAFPFLAGRKFVMQKLMTFPAPESTGLKPLQILPATTKNGQGLYVALAERKDGKGTYLFMMEAPYQYFVNNEDGLEKLLGTVKAKP